MFQSEEKLWNVFYIAAVIFVVFVQDGEEACMQFAFEIVETWLVWYFDWREQFRQAIIMGDAAMLKRIKQSKAFQDFVLPTGKQNCR